MKAGDVVLYSVAGQTHNALVLHAHAGQPQLLGKNGEPLLHLAFLAPERESAIQRAKFGYIPQVFTEFDVVHHSQAFSDEQKRALGITSPAQLAQARGQGEWREIVEVEALDEGTQVLCAKCGVDIDAPLLNPILLPEEPIVAVDAAPAPVSEPNLTQE